MPKWTALIGIPSVNQDKEIDVALFSMALMGCSCGTPWDRHQVCHSTTNGLVAWLSPQGRHDIRCWENEAAKQEASRV